MAGLQIETPIREARNMAQGFDSAPKIKCHSEQSEESKRSFVSLRMTK